MCFCCHPEPSPPPLRDGGEGPAVFCLCLFRRVPHPSRLVRRVGFPRVRAFALCASPAAQQQTLSFRGAQRQGICSFFRSALACVEADRICRPVLFFFGVRRSASRTPASPTDKAGARRRFDTLVSTTQMSSRFTRSRPLCSAEFRVSCETLRLSHFVGAGLVHPDNGRAPSPRPF